MWRGEYKEGRREGGPDDHIPHVTFVVTFDQTSVGDELL